MMYDRLTDADWAEIQKKAEQERWRREEERRWEELALICGCVDTSVSRFEFPSHSVVKTLCLRDDHSDDVLEAQRSDSYMLGLFGGMFLVGLAMLVAYLIFF